jgi:hypothetical protein
MPVMYFDGKDHMGYANVAQRLKRAFGPAFNRCARLAALVGRVSANGYGAVLPVHSSATA